MSFKNYLSLFHESVHNFQKYWAPSNIIKKTVKIVLEPYHIGRLSYEKNHHTVSVSIIKEI